MQTSGVNELPRTRRNLHWRAARKLDRLACTAACAIALLVGVPPAAALAQAQWKMATEYPESNISGVGLATFGQLVSSETHGSVTTLNGFDNQMKISSGEMPRAAQDHRIDGGDALAGTLEASDAVFGLSSLPFVVPSLDTAKAVNAKARPLYERALAARGLKLLYITIWPASGIWSDRPLNNEEDLRALAVRTYDGTSAEVMRSAGATAEFLPFNEAIAKVKEHKLNAILTSGDGGAGRRLWDDLKHFTPINYAFPISIAFVRQHDFNALPKEAQDKVEAARATRRHRRAQESRKRPDHGLAEQSPGRGSRNPGLGQSAIAVQIRAELMCFTAPLLAGEVRKRLGARATARVSSSRP